MPAPRNMKRFSQHSPAIRFRSPSCTFIRIEAENEFIPPPAAPLTMERFLDFRDVIAFARKAHSGQLRISGGDFISHSLAVLQILQSASTDLPEAAYKSAILHDTMEDAKVTSAEIQSMFGEEVSETVAALTRPSCRGRAHDPVNEKKYIRQLIKANEFHPFVLLIKLADRLHNLETSQYLSPDKQLILFDNTQKLYLPAFMAKEHRQVYLKPYQTLLRMVQESVGKLTIEN